jgi:beta-glucosidase-like glycosyl hydrolase
VVGISLKRLLIRMLAADRYHHRHTTTTHTHTHLYADLSTITSTAITGFRGAASTSTAFPASITIAASWDPILAHSWGEAMGDEFFRKGANVQLGMYVRPSTYSF